MTRACLCSSPDVSPAPPSLRTGPSRGAVPPAATSGRGAVTAPPRGEGRKEERQRRAPAPPPCAAHHVSVRGAARTRAPRGEMVRCPRPRPNPAAPRADLRKVRVRVQRLRGGGGGGGRGLGARLPGLEGPTPGGPSPRARFRYWWGPAGCWSGVHAAPPPRLGAASLGLAPALLQRAGWAGGSRGRGVMRPAWPGPFPFRGPF